jgi:HK97 gp10 family phage protein
MASVLSAKVTGEKDLQGMLQSIRRVLPEYAAKAVSAHAIAVQARAKQNISDIPAVDTGRLRSSIKIQGSGISARVGSDVNYAPSIEFGTRPHFPPLEPIRQWCRRHQLPEGIAYVIARKIARNGTPAKPFLFPAFEAERPNFEHEIREAFSQIRGQLG